MLNSIFKFFLKSIPRPVLIRLSYVLRPILRLYLRGSQFTDPIDGKSYRKFLPYGYGIQRKNALAPGTLSLERHRLLWLYLKRETDFFSTPKKVLHIAPEQCFLKKFKKQEHLDYITADLYSPIADIKADICDLPFKSDEFDVVFCNHVLEHVVDDKKAMSELYRVLKSGGLGIFQIPQDLNREVTYEDFSITKPEERAKHFGQYDHVRVYGRDYFDKLRKAGFEVSAVDYTNTMDKAEIEKYRLPEGELLPVCTK